MIYFQDELYFTEADITTLFDELIGGKNSCQTEKQDQTDVDEELIKSTSELGNLQIN